ncbi:MAG: substrate-binding domain-containing protein [Anaerolineales bacterium]|nr:substrate-binding domain-containing protein [Anaerolineales bacterium]
MMHKNAIQRLLSISLIIALLLPLVACNSQPEQTPGDELQGTLTISGAWALYPLMVRWAEEYQLLHSNVRFDISAGGAGKGMADALSRAVDIGMVSREIYPQEIEQGAFWIAVTTDAVFLTANQDSPIRPQLEQRGLQLADLQAIYMTGHYTTWGQVVSDPTNTDAIHVFTRSDACGAADTWAQYLGGNQEDLLGIGVYGDPGVLDAVIKDVLGLGYNNLNFAYDFETGLPVAGAWVVPLDVNENGQVDPEERYDTKAQAIAAVANGHYPAPPARPLYLVTQGPPQGLTANFINWILGAGQAYVDEAGYIPLSAEQLQIEVEKLK